MISHRDLIRETPKENQIVISVLMEVHSFGAILHHRLLPDLCKQGTLLGSQDRILRPAFKFHLNHSLCNFGQTI